MILGVAVMIPGIGSISQGVAVMIPGVGSISQGFEVMIPGARVMIPVVKVKS